MDTPTFLIKDAWSISGNGPTDDMRENSLLNVLHTEFDKSSEFGGSFSQPVSAGSVYVSRGDTHVADSTDTAFGSLPDGSKIRQHIRTVVQWVGNPISTAEDQNQIVVAVADVMIALNEAYTKCKIVHGNISDQAIFIQKTTCGVKGVLGESDHVSYAGDGIVETREHMLFQSIRSLDHPGAARTRLDDWESILYLVCWLGTFGINPAERKEYAAKYAAGCAVGRKPCLHIFDWNMGSAIQISRSKRSCMDSTIHFHSNVLYYMRPGPLRQLAEDIYMALFRHPGCYGTIQFATRYLEEMGDSDIVTALRAIPAIDGRHDPLVLRETYENEIIKKLLQIVVKLKDTALVALPASIIANAAEVGSKAAIPPSAAPAKKSKRDDVPYDGPARRTRSKANH
ncbi:hypothetical protein FBU31_000897 [Coemansia sp. 'formosensis']|nr:hypothetical protein FBU31_000897 [Coemansia sp. 'formosensis']